VLPLFAVQFLCFLWKVLETICEGGALKKEVRGL